jgi:hypothetical protein
MVGTLYQPVAKGLPRGGPSRRSASRAWVPSSPPKLAGISSRATARARKAARSRRSRGAEEPRRRGAEERGGRGAGERGGRGAEGAGGQRSRGAGGQRSRGAGAQGDEGQQVEEQAQGPGAQVGGEVGGGVGPARADARPEGQQHPDPQQTRPQGMGGRVRQPLAVPGRPRRTRVAPLLRAPQGQHPHQRAQRAEDDTVPGILRESQKVDLSQDHQPQAQDEQQGIGFSHRNPHPSPCPEGEIMGFGGGGFAAAPKPLLLCPLRPLRLRFLLCSNEETSVSGRRRLFIKRSEQAVRQPEVGTGRAEDPATGQFLRHQRGEAEIVPQLHRGQSPGERYGRASTSCRPARSSRDRQPSTPS